VYRGRSKDLPRQQTGTRLKRVGEFFAWRNHDLFAKSKTALEMCKKNNLGSDDSKSKLVEKLCKKLQLNEPDEIEEFDGDLSKVPTQLQEISKLPVNVKSRFSKSCSLQLNYKMAC